MRMTRPMGDEDRIPRRCCSFFRRRLRVAACDPRVPGVFSLRDGSDEWAMEAGGVSFHTRSSDGGSAPGWETCRGRKEDLQTTLRLHYGHILLFLPNPPVALWHDGWPFGFLESRFGPAPPCMVHVSHLSESHRNTLNIQSLQLTLHQVHYGLRLHRWG